MKKGGFRSHDKDGNLSFEPLWGRGFTGARSPLWECKGHFAGTPLLIIVKTMGSGDFVPWIFQAIGGEPIKSWAIVVSGWV